MGNRKILISAMITAFMTTFMSSSLNLSIPALESYFQVSAVTVSWIISAYTMSVAALSLPFGKIADITDRRRIFIIGISGFGLLSAACIFAKHIGVLIALRAMMGACGGMIFATNNALLISAYPHEVRGRMIGYSTSATYVGLTAGPVVGGILNSTLGWKSIFAVSVAVSCIALVAAVRAGSVDQVGARAGQTAKAADGTSRGASDMRPDASGMRPDVSGTHFDMTGTILYILAISASLYGMSNLGQSAASNILFAAGLAGLAFFFIYENRREKDSREPMMKVSMFSRSRTFTFSSLAALLNYGATFAISYTISIYLQVIKGMPSSTAGLLLITMPAVQAAFSPLMGSLSDRIRPSILASTGMGFCAFTLLLFSRLGVNTSLAYVMIALCLTGLGFALFSSPNTNAILSCVGREDYGVANSIIATMRTYGQSSGMAILSVITAYTLGTASLESSSPESIISMMHTAFLVFAVLSVIGLVFSLARDSK